MKDIKKSLRVALVQATPVMFDKDATIEKAALRYARREKTARSSSSSPNLSSPATPTV